MGVVPGWAPTSSLGSAAKDLASVNWVATGVRVGVQEVGETVAVGVPDSLEAVVEPVAIGVDVVDPSVVAQCLEGLKTRRWTRLEVKKDAQDAFNAALQAMRIQRITIFGKDHIEVIDTAYRRIARR